MPAQNYSHEGTQVIEGARGSGKTRRLIQWLAADPDRRAIITANVQHALSLVDEMYGSDRALRAAITRHIHPYAPNVSRYLTVSEIGIDDVDLYLSRTLGVGGRISVVTITHELIIEVPDDDEFDAGPGRA